MTIFKKINISSLMVLLILNSCDASKNNKGSSHDTDKSLNKELKVPVFNSDSAFSYIEKQLNFGYRIPNTEAHKKCANYLIEYLKSLNANVIIQKMDLKAYDNTILKAQNIIVELNPDNPNRLLLCAHWDTRPFADNSTDSEEQKKPIPGANDGASGVAVLLEIARQIALHPPQIGIDIILFDAEDYGPPRFDTQSYQGDFWCLGSQYWAKNLHKKNYYARYGILLDMVGGKNAVFAKEQYSVQYAKNITDKVWNTASKLGYGNYFQYLKGNYIIDDHYYINKYAKIPCMDIIQYEPSSISNFPHYWHTHNDNLKNIDKNTLKAVGQTIIEVIYNEK